MEQNHIKILMLLFKKMPLQQCHMGIMAFQMTSHSVQQLVQSHIKEDIKSLHHWPFLREIHQWPMDSPHKGPVMRDWFPNHDITMLIELSSTWMPLSQSGSIEFIVNNNNDCRKAFHEIMMKVQCRLSDPVIAVDTFFIFQIYQHQWFM